MTSRLLICICFLASGLAASNSASDEPSENSWDTDGTAVSADGGITIGSPLPELPALTPQIATHDQGAQSVVVGASADIHKAQAAPQNSGSHLSSNEGLTSVGGLDALPGIGEDRDFDEAEKPSSSSQSPLESLHAGSPATSGAQADPGFSDSLPSLTDARPSLLRREAKSLPSTIPAASISAADIVDSASARTLESTPSGTPSPDTDTEEDLLAASHYTTASPAQIDAVTDQDSGSSSLVARRAREHGDDGEREIHQHHFKEDPSLTPEAIFADKHIDPEVAEFLGHLAQRTRVTHKEGERAARAAGLAQGTVKQTTSASDEKDDTDDSDDIEDMKRAASSLPKKTPLSHFFDKLDSKTSAAAWLPRDCAALAQNVSDKYTKMSGRSRATWATAGPAGAAGRAEIHTGMFFKHWGLNKEADRKLRLSVLSFLGTQDAGKVKLHIWTDQKKDSTALKSMLGPIAHHPELMDAITITTFDHKAEFAKVAPTLARERLTELYKKDSMPNLRADMLRSIILYNYGGLWVDADTILMQDVSPLLGEDWAYLVRGKGGIQGALLSASKPQSHFTSEYLISLVMREPPLDDSEVEKPLLAEVFDKDPSHTTLHVLPPCFFDSDPVPESTGSAVLSSGTSVGSPFFGKNVAEPYRAYFSMGIEDAAKDNSTSDVSVLQEEHRNDDVLVTQDKSSADNEDDEDKSITAPVWAYHWRGNFEAAWARGSLADVAERTFMKRLMMKVQH